MTNTNDKEGAEMFANVFTCRLLSEVNYATVNYTSFINWKSILSKILSASIYSVHYLEKIID